MQATTESTSSTGLVPESIEISEEFQRKLTLDGSSVGDQTEESSPPSDEESDGYNEEDDDFSFSCVVDGDGSPISADDLFHNGQIKPLYPLFDQSLLSTVDSKVDLPGRPPVKKVFVEDKDVRISPETGEMFCAWSGKAVEVASPETCKKSNSTGFSKLFRFRDLLNRSNSDGRDAFVFLNNGSSSSPAGSPMRESTTTTERKARAAVAAAAAVEGGKGKARRKGGKGEKASSSMEAHYSRNRALREGDRRRTYLPYKPEVVGFFTNVNGGLSRNVHPF